jgi:PKD repeat protein
MSMSGFSSRRVGLVLLTTLGLLLAPGLPAFAADPSLSLDRTIRTRPFNGSSISMKDHEGSGFVLIDNSLWLVDDNANAVYEMDATTGALKQMIPRSVFNSAPRFGGSAQAGVDRTDDFESLAYDQVNDRLYLFSGPCCVSSNLPTAFRFTRQSGSLQVESYQPLASGANYTASAWNPADGKIYVGVGGQLRTYNYETNTAGSTFQVSGLSGILGMGFSSDGADLFVVTNAEVLKRVAWASKTIVPGWTFDLLPFGVLDSRAVEVIGDQLYVSDGADSRASDDPLKYAVFVFDVTGSTPVAPTASFNANPANGAAPLSVTFNNTTTGSMPMTWAWDFDTTTASVDSTAQNPTHVYNTPGTYTVALTATNSVSSSTTTRDVVVTEAPPSQEFVGNPGFESNTAGWGTTGSGAGVALTRVTTPTHTGGGAALLRNNSTATRKCVLNDVPNWVTTTQAGLHTGSIWVRGGTAGKKIKITLKEINGGTTVGSRVVTYTLTTSWQRLTVTYTPVRAGTSTLDLQVFMPQDQAPPGVCFYADDASILRS